MGFPPLPSGPETSKLAIEYFEGKRMSIRRWGITAVTAAILAAIIVVSAMSFGLSEEFVRVIVRATARLSVVLFLLAFSASSLYALAPSAAASWVRQNRRYLG